MKKKIDYNNLFFKIDDKFVVKSVDFLKEIGTLYDLLIYLLDNPMRITTSSQTHFFANFVENKYLTLKI